MRFEWGLFYALWLFRGNGSIRLLGAVDDPTAGKIVGRHLHANMVAQQDADVILAHPAGQVRQNVHPIFKLDSELSARQRLDHYTVHFDLIFLFCHGSLPDPAPYSPY